MRILFGIVFLLFVSGVSYAQNEGLKVEKSIDKVILEGKVYFIHLVKSGETLSSISRTYGISEKEIGLENPDLIIGLKVGMSLKIPATPKDSQDLIANESDKFIYYYVKKGDNVFQISQRHGVSQDDIFYYNPGAREKLDLGQLIRIPKQHMVVLRQEFLQEDEHFFYHKVQPKEGFYALKRQYGVNEKKIRRANDGLPKGLLVGTVIRIPKTRKNKHLQGNLPLAKEQEQDTTTIVEFEELVVVDSLPSDECVSEYTYDGERFNIALMLPLKLRKNVDWRAEIDTMLAHPKKYRLKEEQIKGYQEELQKLQLNKTTSRMMSMYEGALLALDSLKKLGVNIDLHVFDTDGKDYRVAQILDEGKLANMDLVIGPLYKKNVQLVSNYLSEYNIPLVSPFASDLDSMKLENYIQIRPSEREQLEQFIPDFAKNYKNNIVILHSGDSAIFPQLDRFKSRLFTEIRKDTLLDDISVREVVCKDSISWIKHALDVDTTNSLVLLAENSGFMSSAVSLVASMKLTYSEYDVRLYGYVNSQRFINNDDLQYYFSLDFHCFGDVRLDYSRKNVQEFVKAYRKKYYTEPVNYSFIGYDMLGFFGKAMHQYGKDFIPCLNKVDFKPTLTEYDFKKMQDSKGVENTKVYFYEYKDADLKWIK